MAELWHALQLYYGILWSTGYMCQVWRALSMNIMFLTFPVSWIWKNTNWKRSNSKYPSKWFFTKSSYEGCWFSAFLADLLEKELGVARHKQKGYKIGVLKSCCAEKRNQSCETLGGGSSLAVSRWRWCCSPPWQVTPGILLLYARLKIGKILCFH